MLASITFSSKPQPNHLKNELVKTHTMFSPFSCTSFNHQEEDEDEPVITKTHVKSLPRKSSRSKSTGLYRRRSKESKNLYSDVGLDKYSAILADLEEKRQKIYAQTGDISFVRFVFKDAIDTKVPIPIVVKLKDKKEDKAKASDHQEEKKHVTHNSEALVSSTVEQCSSKVAKEVKQPKLGCEKQGKNRGVSGWDFKAEEWMRPEYYFPAVVIFILVLLAFFGRSFAILCTSIVWYAIPTLKEGSNSTTTRRGSKKKDYVRSLSANKMVVVGSSRQHRQEKSLNS